MSCHLLIIFFVTMSTMSSGNSSDCSKSRDKALDATKGLLIILIVFVHITAMTTQWINWINTFKLAGFFMVTGIIISQKGDSYNYKRRFKKIFTLYWIFSLILIFLRFILKSIQTGFSSSWQEVILSIKETMTLAGFSTLWFLPALLMAEGMLYVGIILKTRLKSDGIMWVLLITSSILFLFYQVVYNTIIIHCPILQPWFRAIPALIFLVWGYYIASTIRSLNGCKQLIFAVLGVVLGIVLSLDLSEINWNGFQFGNNGLLFLLAGGFSSQGILVLFKVLNQFKLITPIIYLLSWIGENSLIIMVTHHALPYIFLSRAITNLIPCNLSIISADCLTCSWVFLLEIPTILIYKKLKCYISVRSSVGVL